MNFPGRSTADSNRIRGKFFEEVFERFALSQGLLPVRNMLSARPMGNNRWQPIKSQLDFNLYRRGGTVAVIDCKSFQRAFFTYSEIDEKQLHRAINFNRFGIPSGFLVWFRQTNKVSFFSGLIIQKKGSGCRFVPQDGIPLGKWERFVLTPIFDPTIPAPEFY